jgi:hypothetical protein
VISQLTGALVRAFLVVVLVATPSLLLPGLGQDITQMVALLAIFGAFFVLVEYGSSYPGLIEFRDAPPFNRVRFTMLYAMLFLIALVGLGQYEPTALTKFVTAVGLLLGYSVDFPLSPLSVVMNALPRGTTVEQAQMVRISAGLAYLVALVWLTIFAILIRLRSWPSPTGSFNVWINLPTFDPTAGTDVVKRLNRDARINIILGFLLPYITPPLAAYIAGNYNVSIFSNDLTLVWTVTLWAFLPASLFMRGIAMHRLSDMIEAKRKRLVATAADVERALHAF